MRNRRPAVTEGIEGRVYDIHRDQSTRKSFESQYIALGEEVFGGSRREVRGKTKRR